MRTLWATGFTALALITHAPAQAQVVRDVSYHGFATGTDTEGLFGTAGATVTLDFAAEASTNNREEYLFGSADFTDAMSGYTLHTVWDDADGFIMAVGDEIATELVFPDRQLFVEAGANPDGSGTFNGRVFNAANQSVGEITLTLYDVSDAPEPSTWALMFAGVGLAGLALRSRKRNAVASA